MNKILDHIADTIYKSLGTDFGGSPSPPAATYTLYFGGKIKNGKAPADPEMVAQVLNDGFDLYVGYPSEWLINMKETGARKLAWFIIWTWWIKGTWFGLRRVIWYWALHRRVEKTNKLIRERNVLLN